MPEYTYAPPDLLETAGYRIDHWLGDLSEFQQSLGKQPMGYYPRFSGRDFDRDAWALYDDLLHPEPVLEAPATPLKYAWLTTLIRTRDEAVLKFKTATDFPVVRSRVVAKRDELVSRLKQRLHRRFFSWLVSNKPLAPTPRAYDLRKGQQISAEIERDAGGDTDLFT